MDASLAPPPGTARAKAAVVGLLALGLIGVAGSRPSTAADPGFDSYWHDGKAELDGYRFTIVRYGHPRQGRAVAIYVTEPFSRTKHVKLDDPAKAPADAMDVLKLNLVRDFQTGIYDYHTLVSLFASSTDFTPLKVAFSSSEWCGQVYEELNLWGAKLTQRLSSYFEGETSERTLTIPAGGMLEDQLFIVLRGLRSPYLDPGGSRTVPFLASPLHRRLAHRAATWTRARIERLARPETVVVPAGSFATDVYVVRPGDGREGRFYVERSHPRRIVRWAWTGPARNGSPEGTHAAELTGSARLEYWKLNGPGGERYLERIGLEPGVR